MQNSSGTQKQYFIAFHSEGLCVDIVSLTIRTKPDLSTDPCSYPTRCLPGTINVHFYKHKGAEEQRDVQGANEREIDSLSKVEFSLFMRLRPHLPCVRLNKTP